MEIQRDFAEVNGTRLYFETVGSGTPLILLHGSQVDTRMWDDQFEAFALFHQVIRYDQRGWGKSRMPAKGPFRPSDDLKALLEHLGIPRAVILGFSMGGGVAIDFALTYPEMTRALIAVDCAPSGFQMPAEFGVFWNDFDAKLRTKGLNAALAFLLTIPVLRADMKMPGVAPRVEQMIRDDSGYWLNEGEDPRLALETPALQQLDHIRAPTLVLVGEHDYLSFREAADLLFQKIPHAQKVVIPNVGHFSNMGDPQRFNTVVLDFLKRI